MPPLTVRRETNREPANSVNLTHSNIGTTADGYKSEGSNEDINRTLKKIARENKER